MAEDVGVVGEGWVELRPRVAGGFKDDLDDQVKRVTAGGAAKVPLVGEVDTERTKSSVLGAVKGIAAVAGGAFALKGVFDFGKGLIADAEESRKVAAQTEAVIKSTGGAARVTAADIDKLTASLSAKTAIDDEAIAQGANLLLTFTNVRNEAGKGNDIFNQATSTLTDMAAALGGDVAGNAVQLGKALNDPVAGITALTRVGVTFTDQQKEQIKQMAEAGNVAGAQKLILAELNKEFGGSAAAQATAGQRLAVTWGNIREELGARLLPIVDKVATFLADNLPGAIDFAGAAFGRIRTFLAPLGPIFEQAVRILQSFFYTLRSGFSEEDTKTPIEQFAFFVRDTLWPILQQVAAFIADNWKPILIGLAAVFAPIITAVAALAFVIVKNWDTIRSVTEPLIAWLMEQFGNIRDFAIEVFPQIQEAVAHVFNAIRDVVTVVMDVIATGWRLFGDDLLRVASAVFDQIKTYIEFAVNTIASIVRLVLAVINGDWSEALDALKSLVGGAFTFIKDSVGNILNALAGIVGGVFDGMRSAVSAALVGILDFAKGLPGRIISAIGNLNGLLVDAGKDLMRGFMDGIKSLAHALLDVLFNVFGPLEGTVRKLLGSRSPSRVFVDIGRSVPEGFVDGVLAGIRAERPTLDRELADFMSPADLAANAQAAVSGGGSQLSPAGLAALVAQGPLVQIDVHGNADEATVEQLRQVARDEIVAALERILGRVTAGTGTRS